MPSFIWPSLKRRNVGPAGEVARLLHWIGVIAAGLCLLMAIEFAVEGWAEHLSRALALTAVVLVFGTRALRYALARE